MRERGGGGRKREERILERGAREVERGWRDGRERG